MDDEPAGFTFCDGIGEPVLMRRDTNHVLKRSMPILVVFLYQESISRISGPEQLEGP